MDYSIPDYNELLTTNRLLIRQGISLDDICHNIFICQTLYTKIPVQNAKVHTKNAPALENNIFDILTFVYLGPSRKGVPF